MKVNDYVRTDTGQIGKIILFEGDLVRVDTDKFITYKSNHNEIIKSSTNIIDLIEVGDYVNGNLVSYIGSDCIEVYWYKDEMQWLEIKDIKSIVTKEQFERCEYNI